MLARCRPAAREQIISVGATPVELDLPTEESEGAGGYAKEQSEEFLQLQRKLMTEVVARQDIIITTAAVPGAKSPILVTEDMLVAMKSGSVVVDLAAERGGNCELTKMGQTTVAHGVTILGPENLARFSGPRMVTPCATVVCPIFVSSQLPPRSAARSTTTDPDFIATSISSVTKMGDLAPGTAAVVIIISCLATTSVINFLCS